MVITPGPFYTYEWKIKTLTENLLETEQEKSNFFGTKLFVHLPVYAPKITGTLWHLKKNAPGLQGAFWYCISYADYFLSPSACSNFSLIEASAPKSPRVAFSTLACIVFTALLVLSASTLASLRATSFSWCCACSHIRV